MKSKFTFLLKSKVRNYLSAPMNVKIAYNSWISNLRVYYQAKKQISYFRIYKCYILIIQVNIWGYRRYDDRPREMHDITCSECGEKAQVPFKPDGERPVYCRECFQKHRRY